MTNTEAIIATLQIAGYSDSAIQKALLDSNINGDGLYDGSNAKDIDLIAIEILQGMLSVASVTEGGYSVSYSLNGIKARLDFLNGKYGLETGKPSISAPKVW